MSWLLFNQTRNELKLFAGNPPRLKSGIYTVDASKLLGKWSAHNEVATISKGRWPKGMFEYSRYNPHLEIRRGSACSTTGLGCEGIHIFTVKGRTGMGVHAGRSNRQISINRKNENRSGYKVKLGGKTLGCIRTYEAAMRKINSIHRNDPLEAILVCG